MHCWKRHRWKNKLASDCLNNFTHEIVSLMKETYQKTGSSDSLWWTEYFLICAGVVFIGVQHFLNSAVVSLSIYIQLGFSLIILSWGYSLQNRLKHFTNLKEITGWEFRTESDPGLWCCTLLPLALLANPETHTREQVQMSLLTTVLQVSSIFVIRIALQNESNGNEKLSLVYITEPFLVPNTVAIIVMLYNRVDIFTIIGSIMLNTLFVALLNSLPKKIPGSFTYGEATIICQGIVIILLSFIHSLVHAGLGLGSNKVSLYPSFGITAVTQTATMLCLVLVFLLSTYPCLQTTGGFISTIAVLGSVAAIVVWYLLQENPVIWLLWYIFQSKQKIMFIAYWVIVTSIALLIVKYQSQDKASHPVSTVVRKYFHFVAIAIFVPGLNMEPELLCLASVGAYVIFIILECIRVFQISPLGHFLDSSLQVFVDNKDKGAVILTHIYLLVGFSVPMWIYQYPLGKANHLSLYSGVISLGIGDTAASVIGSKFGKHKWPGSFKSLEGTAAALLSQMLFIVVIRQLGIHPQYNAMWLQTSMVVVMTTLLEAVTSQIDNLVLPLYMFALLAWL